ncbi:hypothetical protein M2277_004966 [Paenibacillus sp. LBL]|nr:hypothetical protein [Paenibacillus sp. LBL]
MIEVLDYIRCDDGNTYHITHNWKDDNYKFMLCLGNKSVNEVHPWYLNDCYEYGESICVGESENREHLYAKIVSVYDALGRLKSTK